MDLNLYLIVSGSLSSMIFAGVLLFSKTNQYANRFLALLIGSLGLNLLLSWSLNVGLFNKYPFLHILPYGVGFGLGPVVYLYIWKLCKEGKPDYRHLLWFLLDYPHSIYHIIYGRSFPYHTLHEVLDKLGFLSVIIIAYYLWKSRYVILEYQKEIRHKLSNVELQTLDWLKQLTMLFLLSIPIAFILWVLLITTGLDFDDRFGGHLFYVVAIYWLGIGGIRQPEIVDKNLIEPLSEAIKQDVMENLKLLIECMDHDKLYLLSDLKVRYLEDRLGLTAKQISEALNKGLGKNFYTFINEYRVNEFKLNLAEKPHLTLAGLAMDCGFNSKTTFQRVFKELTGLRPSEYLTSL